MPSPLPGYRIIRLLGSGSTGLVHLAEQESYRRLVALKRTLRDPQTGTESSDRLLAAAQIATRLRHPHLVAIYDSGRYGGISYLAMEYLPGGSLRERISRRALPVAAALDTLIDIARGLQHVHDAQIVHGDIAPGNILFRANGEAVLGDFGAAVDMVENAAATALGTPNYMSPEQAAGMPADPRADWYSLGAVLFEMLTGTSPYQANSPDAIADRHVTWPIPRLPYRQQWLQPLLEGLMAKTPGERIANLTQLWAVLEPLLAAAPEAAGLSLRLRARKGVYPPVGQRQNPAQSNGLFWLFWSVGSMAVIILLGLVWWLH